MNRFSKSLIGTVVLASTATYAQAQNSNIPERSIVEISDNVYRLQNNAHYSLMVITDEGAVVVDPINAGMATYINDQIENLTDQPITHLIYSHSHGDHASGGALLAGGADVIAHANAPDRIDGVAPTSRFEDTMEFSLGDKNFELTYLGPGHGDDLIAVVVRPDNVAFITDAAAPKRLPFRNFGGANIDDWIAQVAKVTELEFDIFAPAHGDVGTKSDAFEVLAYMETLRSQVLYGLKAGKSPAELQESIAMADYSDWKQYEAWLPENIQGMANFLTSSGQIPPE